MNIDNALTEGYMLHHYRIAKTIGGGGFSIVYLARNTQTGKWVVIKEYLPDKQIARIDGETVESLSNQTTNNFNTGMKRFFDEAKALSKIRHPNIVRVTDFFRENNTVYMVMNYEDGKDLRWYIKRHNGRLSEKFIRTVFPKLMEGLDAMHKTNMLHLDIKPANILIRPGGKPLLLDFGATKESLISNRSSGPHTLTMGFAPLEQHRHAHVGPWSDIYALGATMYACIAGKSPPNALEREQKDRLKPTTKTYGRYYSKQILETIDWCLQLHQLQRPQSIQELVEYMDRDWLEDGDRSGLMGYLDDFVQKLPKFK